MESDSQPQIYFVERRLNTSRLNHLTSLAKRSELFRVCSDPRKATVLVSQESTGNEVVEYLAKRMKLSADDLVQGKRMVDILWFTECMKEKSLLPMQSQHLLTYKKKHHKESSNADLREPSAKRAFLSPERMAMYACQRCTPLKYPNKKLTDALEILEEHALFRGDKNGDVRALAFRRGSATLKACTSTITKVEDLHNLPYIDSSNSSKAGHCKKVIVEILEEGFSDEVENVRNSDFYRSIKAFSGIFGVGPQTARKWYFDLGLRTLEDVQKKKVVLTKEQTLGVQHYQDINTPVTIEEATYIQRMITDTCHALRNGLTVTLVGGFRRGKSEGHDVDLIISHPEIGQEKGVLPLILEKLKEHFIFTGRSMSSSRQKTAGVSSSSTMDHFEKCLSIFKFKMSWLRNLFKDDEWKAVRVDLIVVPANEFAYAVLGWTGTKHFEREIRRYAREKREMVLTSHGLFSIDYKQSFPAKTEEEIFQLLDLEFRDPSERCC